MIAKFQGTSSDCAITIRFERHLRRGDSASEPDPSIYEYVCTMEEALMRFEWDEDKNRRNLAKHKVSFETASFVFEDPQALSIPDRVVEGEERWQMVGMVSGVLLFVAYTYRDEASGEVIRLISARKATAHERKAYAKSEKRTGG
jgi:uncharacterized protein